MSNEEMNQKMEFVVEQQAQFVADIEVMRQVQAQDAKLFKEQDRKLSDALIAVSAIVGNLTQAQTHADDQINQLAGSFKRLAEAEARTEEHLNIFISVVERHIGGNDGARNRA